MTADNMIHFTSYSNQKFDILNKHKVFIRKEQVEEAVLMPDKIVEQGEYIGACKEGLKVIYQRQDDIIRIITFFPIKNS